MQERGIMRTDNELRKVIREMLAIASNRDDEEYEQAEAILDRFTAEEAKRIEELMDAEFEGTGLRIRRERN
jgi:DNA-binding GntR family transcriptional regulator